MCRGGGSSRHRVGKIPATGAKEREEFAARRGGIGSFYNRGRPEGKRKRDMIISSATKGGKELSRAHQRWESMQTGLRAVAERVLAGGKGERFRKRH